MKAKIMIKYLIDKYIRKNRFTMSENAFRSQIGSVTGPSEIIKFKKNNPIQIPFDINIVGLDEQKLYTVQFMVQKDGKMFFSSTPSVFGKEQMKKINDDYVTSLTMTFNANFKTSGIYNVKIKLIQVLDIGKDGGAGIITDVQETRFVAEESRQ